MSITVSALRTADWKPPAYRNCNLSTFLEISFFFGEEPVSEVCKHKSNFFSSTNNVSVQSMVGEFFFFYKFTVILLK